MEEEFDKKILNHALSGTITYRRLAPISYSTHSMSAGDVTEF